MAVNGITGLQNPSRELQIRPELFAKDAPVGLVRARTETGNQLEDPAAIKPGIQKPEKKSNLIKREDLVLKLQPVSFKERMDQVISLEEVQRLLLLRAPYPNAADQKISIGSGSMIDFTT